ncbi:MAG TPA: hypothetical protein P5247_01590, partial [Candidatus Saccharimonadales bacterium]|nr:hypothetical protein [Candidatus Saccharimonadales bacterium]
MGRKKTITKLSESYALNAFVEAPIFDWKLSRISYWANIITLSAFTTYFLGSLHMIDKLFTFIISGKIMGTNYELTFTNVCWISAGIISSLLAWSIYSYLKV